MKKGEIMTEAQKRKIGDSNKGHKHSSESRLKMSISHTGVPLSDDHKRRLSESHTGRVFSEETRAKISEVQKGKIIPPEQREKISAAQKKRYENPEARAKISASHKGKRPSEVTRKKMSLSMRGKHSKDKHYRWKGGITPLNKTIRKCPKMNEWKEAIFVRDNYTCQRTGQHGGILEVHHIIPFSALMTEYHITTLEEAEACPALWDTRNGITLSKEAHRAIHRSKS
jgi:5-methylcytosine-specific restriction endonuclease McrA